MTELAKGLKVVGVRTPTPVPRDDVIDIPLTAQWLEATGAAAVGLLLDLLPLLAAPDEPLKGIKRRHKASMQDDGQDTALAKRECLALRRRSQRRLFDEASRYSCCSMPRQQRH